MGSAIPPPLENFAACAARATCSASRFFVIVGACANSDVFTGFRGLGSRVLSIASVSLLESIKEPFLMRRWGACNGARELALWRRGT